MGHRLKRLSSLRQPERVRSWLVAISANEARGLVRRAERREVAETSTKERQWLPAWWPRGHSDHEQGRSWTMLCATGTVAVAALTLIGASLALPALVADPDDTVAPAGAAIEVGDDWAFFPGTLRYSTAAIGGFGEVELIDGLVVQSGDARVGETLITDDPRMTGTRVYVANTFQNLSGESGGSFGQIWASAVTIETDGGRWICRLDGVAVDPLSSESGWCDGLDGYEGLGAYVAFDTDGDGPPVPAPTTD